VPAKLTKTINKIQTVQNSTNVVIISHFYNYMKSSGMAGNHQNNCLKVANAYAKFLGPDTK
jgi:predicted metallo-beta-lactamase superfamily hydrolase